MRAGSKRSYGRGPGTRLLLAMLAALPLVSCAAGSSSEGVHSRSAESADAASGPGPAGPQDRREQHPGGVVRVAYPEEPGSWYPPGGEEPASIDLAALWGLPLYHVDPYGQLRPALAESSVVHPGSEGTLWEVDIRLRSGCWSDGRPVVAGDVVATLDAMRSTQPSQLEALLEARTVDEHTVRLTFSRPYGRWPYLLAGGTSVLPAHVLAGSGLNAYANGVPVVGGPFRLETHDPGLRATFVAHPDSPLGSPALHRIEIYFTPSYETALGLLRDHKVDVALGYLALNPLERARRVEEVEAAAPLGGTWMVVDWRSGGRVSSSPQRRVVTRDAVNPSELVEGLLGGIGEVMTSTIPGLDGPWSGVGKPLGRLGGVDLELLVPAHQEALHFTARALLLDLRSIGAEAHLVSIEPDELSERAVREADGNVLVRRDLPRPSLLAQAPPDAPADLRAVLIAADAAGSTDALPLDLAFERLHDYAADRPLYRIGVAHVWHRSLLGFRASSWPGLAFWDSAAWRWRDQEPVPQVPTLDGR